MSSYIHVCSSSPGHVALRLCHVAKSLPHRIIIFLSKLQRSRLLKNALPNAPSVSLPEGVKEQDPHAGAGPGVRVSGPTCVLCDEPGDEAAAQTDRERLPEWECAVSWYWRPVCQSQRPERGPHTSGVHHRYINNVTMLRNTCGTLHYYYLTVTQNYYDPDKLTVYQKFRKFINISTIFFPVNPFKN